MAKRERVVVYKIHGFSGERTAGPYTEQEARLHLQDIEGYEGVHDARIEGTICHVLVHGRALCGFPDIPLAWPVSHVWVNAAEISDVTCKRCQADHRALQRK